MARILSCTVVLLTFGLWPMSSLAAEQVVQSPRQIPTVADVDVVVVGSSSGAVEAACEAARQGRRVFLLAPRPYLGDDLCATLRLWLEPGEEPQSKLAVACFGRDRVTTPLRVKAAMDQALLAAGVSYLTGCYVTDVLRDREGSLAGIVMANRSGRQAVRAKVVIDATGQAAVARLAGAAFRPFVPGPQTFRRVVIGGPMREGDGVSADKMPFTCDFTVQKTKRSLNVYEYTLRIDLPDASLASFQRAEHRARDLTYAQGSEAASEVLYHVPSDTIVGQRRLETWPGAESADLGPFRTKDVARLYVLNAYADLAGNAAEKLLRPLELITMGTRIGRAAAEEARATRSVDSATLPDNAAPGDAAVDVGEETIHPRSPLSPPVQSGRRTMPVLGRYDVVVVGGGTSGSPAGIGAARSGAKTLVVEYLHELGGVGTAGLIGAYWHGVRNGYTKYVDEHVNPGRSAWHPVAKAEWLRRELIDAGADVWFGTLACGAIVDAGQVRGVVVATPQGRGVVLATTVIDATGNANVAACASAPTHYGISALGSLNVQIAGFPPRPLGASFVNTCYTMVDDTDVLDVWHLMAFKRIDWRKTPAFDAGQLVDSRERRRVVGDYTLTVEDILGRRTFPDTISHHYSNFDAAAFPDSRLLLLANAKGPCFHADLPYRCLLPKGLDGILVIGLGASAERDVTTLIRMQADLQNQGYAAGIAAAAAARAGGHTRQIDLKAVQNRLIREGVLEERVATDRDSFPESIEVVQQAVRMLGESNDRDRLASLAVVLAHDAASIPLLKTAYRDARDDQQHLIYAKVLGILGDPTGAASLVAAVDAHPTWDQGMALTSQRDTGNMYSQLDRVVIALGFSRAPESLAPLLHKLAQLTPESELSHYKAISLALWENRSREAIEPLAKLLDQPGFTGHATVCPVGKPKEADGQPPANAADRLVTADADRQANTTNLNRAMKELIVATMLYRSGDRNGRAESILKRYSADVHGHFARYAQGILGNRP
jgi:flavin-dependent dehydrogenase